MNEQASPRSGLGTKFLGIIVLLIAAWVLFKVVIGAVAAVAWIVVIIGALFAVFWALNVLRS